MQAVRQTYRVNLTDAMKVMVATTGATLLPEKAVKTLCKELLPKTYILTPNIPEANLILREAGQKPIEIKDLEGLKKLASALQTLGPKYVLVKGGHLPLTSDYKVAKTDKEKQIVVNVLLGRDFNTGVGVLEVIESPYQKSRNTHGTGDSLASAISCNLADRQDIVTAVRNACRYVEAGIRTSTNLGQGSGPLNHFHSLQILPFAPGTFIDYVLSRPDVKAAWHDFTHHEFVRRMGDGTLPRETFKYYMIQDYLYLVRQSQHMQITQLADTIQIHFARAHALAGFKSKNLDDIADVSMIFLAVKCVRCVC
jgi:hydroxymethylpyrimidine kinase/phosphomethylpyrimidine kinase